MDNTSQQTLSLSDAGEAFLSTGTSPSALHYPSLSSGERKDHVTAIMKDIPLHSSDPAKSWEEGTSMERVCASFLDKKPLQRADTIESSISEFHLRRTATLFSVADSSAATDVTEPEEELDAEDTELPTRHHGPLLQHPTVLALRHDKCPPSHSYPLKRMFRASSPAREPAVKELLQPSPEPRTTFLLLRQAGPSMPDQPQIPSKSDHPASPAAEIKGETNAASTVDKSRAPALNPTPVTVQDVDNTDSSDFEDRALTPDEDSMLPDESGVVPAFREFSCSRLLPRYKQSGPVREFLNQLLKEVFDVSLQDLAASGTAGVAYEYFVWFLDDLSEIIVNDKYSDVDFAFHQSAKGATGPSQNALREASNHPEEGKRPRSNRNEGRGGANRQYNDGRGYATGDENDSNREESEDDPEDGREFGARKRQKVSPMHLFSCPFRKRNPLRFNVRSFRDCATRWFPTMSLLKYGIPFRTH